jgi:CDP-glycerol glycerophosphotransferase (TagB/SpsB family)
LKPETYTIAVFFSGSVDSYYQIEQWRKPFEALNEGQPLLYIVTNYSVYLRFVKTESLPVIYLKTFTDLINFYQEIDLSVILYINNALRNFHSLRHGRSYHVHLNHGESEKESMYSNQSQGYDWVCTVGQRGIDRYREHLLNFQADKYVAIGRPQLDFIEQPVSPAKLDQRIILYAPTWEATHPSMNYTSVPVCGVELVQQILEHENYYLIYKPHAALGSRDEACRRADQQIRQLIAASENACDMSDEPINNVFTLVDFAFFDNSSVMIDYLHTDKPAAYLEIREDQSVHLLAEAFMTVNPLESDMHELAALLTEGFSNDARKSRRQAIKQHYLGNYQQGESTETFINLMDNLVNKRQQRLSKQ